MPTLAQILFHSKLLAARTQTFDLSKPMAFVGYVTLEELMTVEEGLQIFDSFFSELRYPQRREMKQVDGLGPEHKLLLDSLVEVLRHTR